MVGNFLHRSTMTFKRGGMTAVSDELSPFAPSRMARIIKNVIVMEVDAGLTMKFTQIYDEVPHRFSTIRQGPHYTKSTLSVQAPT